MFTLSFWKDAFERAVKTFTQFIMVLGGGSFLTDPSRFDDINWGQLIVISLVGFAVSIVFSLASTLKGDSSSASLLK